jgi:hypothetical protein
MAFGVNKIGSEGFVFQVQGLRASKQMSLQSTRAKAYILQHRKCRRTQARTPRGEGVGGRP